MLPPVAILTLERSLQDRACALSRQLDIPLAEPADQGERLLLELSTQGLSLVLVDGRQPLRMRVDFLSTRMQRRLQAGMAAREALTRAVGANKQPGLQVLDATAGFGRDSSILAAAGCKVVATERHPVVAALLADGLLRALESPDLPTPAWTKQIELQCIDACEFMANNQNMRLDVIYLDPMFAIPGRRALPKKSMQLLDRLTAKGDPDMLLATAERHARARVVVKRPLKGPFLGGSRPSFSLPGRSCRFDVYARAGLNPDKKSPPRIWAGRGAEFRRSGKNGQG